MQTSKSKAFFALAATIWCLSFASAQINASGTPLETGECILNRIVFQRFEGNSRGLSAGVAWPILYKNSLAWIAPAHVLGKSNRSFIIDCNEDLHQVRVVKRDIQRDLALLFLDDLKAVVYPKIKVVAKFEGNHFHVDVSDLINNSFLFPIGALAWSRLSIDSKKFLVEKNSAEIPALNGKALALYESFPAFPTASGSLLKVSHGESVQHYMFLQLEAFGSRSLYIGEKDMEDFLQKENPEPKSIDALLVDACEGTGLGNWENGGGGTWGNGGGGTWGNGGGGTWGNGGGIAQKLAKIPPLVSGKLPTELFDVIDYLSSHYAHNLYLDLDGTATYLSLPLCSKRSLELRVPSNNGLRKFYIPYIRKDKQGLRARVGDFTQDEVQELVQNVSKDSSKRTYVSKSREIPLFDNPHEALGAYYKEYCRILGPKTTAYLESYDSRPTRALPQFFAASFPNERALFKHFKYSLKSVSKQIGYAQILCDSNKIEVELSVLGDLKVSLKISALAHSRLEVLEDGWSLAGVFDFVNTTSWSNSAIDRISRSDSRPAAISFHYEVDLPDLSEKGASYFELGIQSIEWGNSQRPPMKFTVGN